MLWAGQAVWTGCSSKQTRVCKQHPKDLGLNTASDNTPRNRHAWKRRSNHLRHGGFSSEEPHTKHLGKSFYCFCISAGRVPGSKDSAKPPAKWQMAVQMQRPLEDPGKGEEKSTYTKVQPLNTRWHWQVSSNRADQHHPSHQQNKKLITEIPKAWIPCPTRAEQLHWNMYSSQDSTLFMPRCCSMCGSACHTQGRALP